MSDEKAFTVRLKPPLYSKLEQLCKTLDRSKNWVTEKALEAFMKGAKK